MNWLIGLLVFVPLLSVFAYFAAYRLRLLLTHGNPLVSCDKAAAVSLVVLLPLSAFLTAKSGYLFFVMGPVSTLILPLFVTTLAGRRPFLYSMGTALLYLLSTLLWLYGISGWTSPDAGTAEIVRDVFVLVALAGGFISGLGLFLLWRRNRTLA